MYNDILYRYMVWGLHYKFNLLSRAVLPHGLISKSGHIATLANVQVHPDRTGIQGTDILLTLRRRPPIYGSLKLCSSSLGFGCSAWWLDIMFNSKLYIVELFTFVSSPLKESSVER